MTPVNVTEALSQRKSARVFLDRPVAAAMVREVLELAGRSPSGGNLQPWKVYALSGEARNRLCKRVMARAQGNTAGEKAELSAFPTTLQEPWRSRRTNSDEMINLAVNISRENETGSSNPAMGGFCFFDAPVGLIITMDRSLGKAQIMDTGIFLHSILLLAHERGLATCLQTSWSQWSETVREVLKLHGEEMIMAGIALGYAKQDEPVNGISQPQMQPDQFIAMHGF